MKLRKILTPVSILFIKTLYNRAITTLLLFYIISSVGCSPKSDNQTHVKISNNQWQINGEPTNKGSEAEGLLMNIRMVNSVFEDMGPSGKEHLNDFDPEENTSRFIQSIPKYIEHGVNGFTISLQGGLPGYEGAINSAFNADGSLRKNYLDRVTRVIQAADQHGVVIILTCFYQRQHSHERAFNGKQAIMDAAENVARWISGQGFTNVLLEISNEYAHGGFKNWNAGEWLLSVPGQVELIHHAKAVSPNLLVSTSGMGNGLIPPDIAHAADFILIHFNNTPVAEIPDKIEKVLGYGKPIICNEDDKIGQIGAEAARLSVVSGAGWGFMHSKKNQHAPFEFEGATDDTAVYQMISRLTTPNKSIKEIQETPISVLITTPKDGDVFPPDNPITIKAVTTGLDNFGDTQVQFFANNKPIGNSNTSPWEITWDHIPIGKYELKAVVKDSQGQVFVTSRIVDFEIKPSQSLQIQ